MILGLPLALFGPLLLIGCAMAGLTYSILQALRAGADAYASQYRVAAARQLEDLFVFIPPQRVLEIAQALAVICFVAVFLVAGGLTYRTLFLAAAFALPAGYGGWQVPGAVLRWMKLRRVRRFNEQLANSLVNMSNALRAGFSIQQSFEAVVKEQQNPISQEFSVLLHQMRVGLSMEEAFANLQKRVESQDVALMVNAVEIARQTGGNLTEVLERIAYTIRERLRIERRIRTLTAQGRLQGIVVGSMPLLLGIAMFYLDPRMMLEFLRSNFGLGILAGVLALLVAGALLIRKIIRIDI
jgi:tight adherence protein B